MAVVITRYETGQDVKFDLSKFDYYYDSDSFPTDAQEDFENIIDEIGGNFEIESDTSTNDGMGTTKEISKSSFSIKAYIMDISKKDRKVHEMGLAVSGNRIAYFKQEYDDSNVIKEGNILVDRDSNRWRIVTILVEPYVNATQTYKKAIIKSIGLKGS